MTTKEFIEDNKTGTFKTGDNVIMNNCMEADIYPGKIWACRSDSYKDKSGQDVVFLHKFAGCFLAEYLEKV